LFSQEINHMQNKSEAIAILANEQRVVPADAEFSGDYFRPEDAPGVARLFYLVYGEGYPIDTFYIPEKLIGENRKGDIRSVVARTTEGDIVAHAGLYRSSPPNPALFEYGVGLSLPEFRSRGAFSVTTPLINDMVGKNGVDGMFGEAVCNHIIIQKICNFLNNLETGIEPALMPAEAYTKMEGAPGRVGCMFYSRVDHDIRRKLYVPAHYRNELTMLLDGLGLERDMVDPETSFEEGICGIDTKVFDTAGVMRCTVTEPGADFEKRLDEFNETARTGNLALIQFFINLGKPWSGPAVNALRNKGYSFGGLLPIWFGEDGLLMQKHFVDPGFENLKIFSDRGRMVTEMVKKDWERANHIELKP
jgi:hypothetical protein